MEQLQEGFTGELPKVHLADVLQLHNQNRFSGALSIQQNQSKGSIFFQKGEVIHAEQDDIIGIDAIYRMLTWKGGRFVCHPNLQTMHSSIKIGMSQLLLECHRRLDEDAMTQNEVESSPTRPEKAIKNKVVNSVMPIPGVNYAVMIDENGHPQGDASSIAAKLSAQGHFLGDMANNFGALFGAQGCHFSVFSGQEGHCMTFHSANRSLIVITPGNCEYQPIESAIRSTLAGK